MQQLRASSPNVYLRKVFGHAGARVEVSGPPLLARSSGQHLASAGASTSATSGRHGAGLGHGQLRLPRPEHARVLPLAVRLRLPPPPGLAGALGDPHTHRRALPRPRPRLPRNHVRALARSRRLSQPLARPLRALLRARPGPARRSPHHRARRPRPLPASASRPPGKRAKAGTRRRLARRLDRTHRLCRRLTAGRAGLSRRRARCGELGRGPRCGERRGWRRRLDCAGGPARRRPDARPPSTSLPRAFLEPSSSLPRSC